MTGRLLLGCGAFTAQAARGDSPAAGRGLVDIVGHAEIAEDLGLDGFWLGEHHFARDGYTSSVFPLLGALAARTRKLTLGTRVVLAPLHNALLLAEDASQVAVLSEGRFILGMALGYRDEEFRSLRVPKEQRVARLVEAVEVCRKAWTGQPFDHNGPSVDARGIVCRPAPLHPPQVWLGGRSLRAIDRAALLADGFVAPLDGPDETATLVAHLDRSTRTERAPLPVCSSRLVAVLTGGRADDAITRGIAQVSATYRGWKGADEGINAQTVTSIDRGVAAGSPQTVADALLPLVRHLEDRTHHLVVRLEYPGMTAQQVADHIEMFCSEVAPLLRSAHRAF